MLLDDVTVAPVLTAYLKMRVDFAKKCSQFKFTKIDYKRLKIPTIFISLEIRES